MDENELSAVPGDDGDAVSEGDPADAAEDAALPAVDNGDSTSSTETSVDNGGDDVQPSETAPYDEPAPLQTSSAEVPTDQVPSARWSADAVSESSANGLVTEGSATQKMTAATQDDKSEQNTAQQDARSSKPAIANTKASTTTREVAHATITTLSSPKKSKTASAAPKRAAQGAKTGVVADGTYWLESGAAYHEVIDVKGGSKDPAANVQIYHSNKSGAQQWKLVYDARTGL